MGALAAVLFDLDGTLVDTAGDFIPAVQALRAAHGLPPLAPAVITAQVSNGAAALVHLALGLATDAPDYPAARLALLDLYGERLGQHSGLYPGLAELLRWLDAHGIGWGIVTNKPRAYTLPLLETLGLPAAPSVVVCPEDVCAPKPHPAALLHGCRLLGVAPRATLYAGDHLRDIRAARWALMPTVAAAYGYLGAEDPRAWGADHLAETSHALARLVTHLLNPGDHSGGAPGHTLKEPA